MKRAAMLIFIVLFLPMMIAGCSGGDVSNVHRQIGESEIYSTREIGDAMDAVQRCFSRGFEGCTLLELTYDESFSQPRADDWAEQYGAEEAIVLTSSFYVDASGGDGCLEPDSTYRNYQWILVRSGWGGWKLKTWGYG